MFNEWKAQQMAVSFPHNPNPTKDYSFILYSYDTKLFTFITISLQFI